MIPVLITLPFAVFGMVFQLSFITVGKAGFGAALSVMGGVLNIVLDWLFIAIFHWGLAGGAVVDFFAKNNAQVETIALYGFRIVATSFLMMACNVFASGWFTALNICDLIVLQNGYLYDRAGTGSAGDLWHGWSMDVHYSW